uniref:Uncharacterized protein n=1 Tax=Rhizophora mucronata TaxID=61149 RepID=A0A2P2R0B3_RHIMU
MNGMPTIFRLSRLLISKSQKTGKLKIDQQKPLIASNALENSL